MPEAETLESDPPTVWFSHKLFSSLCHSFLHALGASTMAPNGSCFIGIHALVESPSSWMWAGFSLFSEIGYIREMGCDLWDQVTTYTFLLFKFLILGKQTSHGEANIARNWCLLSTGSNETRVPFQPHLAYFNCCTTPCSARDGYPFCDLIHSDTQDGTRETFLTPVLHFSHWISNWVLLRTANRMRKIKSQRYNLWKLKSL